MLDELKNIIAINKNLEEIYKSEEFSQFLAKLIEYKLSEKQTDNEEYVNIVYAAKQFDLNLEDIVEKYLKDLPTTYKKIQVSITKVLKEIKVETEDFEYEFFKRLYTGLDIEKEKLKIKDIITQVLGNIDDYYKKEFYETLETYIQIKKEKNEDYIEIIKQCENKDDIELLIEDINRFTIHDIYPKNENGKRNYKGAAGGIPDCEFYYIIEQDGIKEYKSKSVSVTKSIQYYYEKIQNNTHSYKTFLKSKILEIMDVKEEDFLHMYDNDKIGDVYFIINQINTLSDEIIFDLQNSETTVYQIYNYLRVNSLIMENGVNSVVFDKNINPKEQQKNFKQIKEEIEKNKDIKRELKNIIKDKNYKEFYQYQNNLAKKYGNKTIKNFEEKQSFCDYIESEVYKLSVKKAREANANKTLNYLLKREQGLSIVDFLDNRNNYIDKLESAINAEQKINKLLFIGLDSEEMTEGIRRDLLEKSSLDLMNNSKEHSHTFTITNNSNCVNKIESEKEKFVTNFVSSFSHIVNELNYHFNGTDMGALELIEQIMPRLLKVHSNLILKHIYSNKTEYNIAQNDFIDILEKIEREPKYLDYLIDYVENEVSNKDFAINIKKSMDVLYVYCKQKNKMQIIKKLDRYYSQPKNQDSYYDKIGNQEKTTIIEEKTTIIEEKTTIIEEKDIKSLKRAYKNKTYDDLFDDLKDFEMTFTSVKNIVNDKDFTIRITSYLLSLEEEQKDEILEYISTDKEFILDMKNTLDKIVKNEEKHNDLINKLEVFIEKIKEQNITENNCDNNQDIFTIKNTKKKGIE